MHRRRLDSSAVRSAGYDRDRRILEIEITGGAVYQYLDVPAREFMALLAADSHGRYYNEHIKPAYEYRRQ
jgi:hypothetical protein